MRIVTPGTRAANNGNWRTADRWSRLLRSRFRVILQTAWDGEPADILVALHARRSAGAVAKFRDARPRSPLVVVLTGTDLYRDLPGSAEAHRSLALADRLIVLQPDAIGYLPLQHRGKAMVVLQSAPQLATLRKPASRLDAVAVGHLREEKDPETIFAAFDHLDPGMPLRFRHVGDALDAGLGRAALRLARRDPRYRYAGALPHGLARIAIQRSHVLVHPSRLEGGANVVVEAIRSGTPVVASRMSGNVGLLGDGYAGYFAVGDAMALAALLERCHRDRPFLSHLGRQCAARRALFSPQAERRSLIALLDGLVRSRNG